ncbi:MAG: hypothetical protein EZS28_017028 [Streblomastix strix]|uniref:C2 domain-containing protein n=1 Tax=Streblomastix strix TaxID=222440 RepID=A0A5J4VXX1_9EUKA|nr:MAG: hypothetical protein EZS28_017028 [Streblomastix strix]
MDALDRAVSSQYATDGSTQPIAIRICVIEARELKGKNSSSMSDPVCYVNVCGKQDHTSIEKKTLSPYWEQSFYYEIPMTRDKFENSTINFSVYNANTVRRNELIGAYQIDLSRVWGEENHEMWRQWLGLYNADLGPEIQGYLRCSVCVMKPGDVCGNHDDDEDDEEVEGEDLQKMVLLPPQVERHGYLLKTRAYKGDHLFKADTFGKIDAFIQINFASNTKDTAVIREDLNPVWNQEVRLPVYVPCLTDRIAVRLMDWERVGSSRAIATSNFRWSSVVVDHFGPAWVNKYGVYPQSARDTVQVQKVAKTVARISKGDMPASSYKGRCLLALLGEREQEPQLGLATIAPCEEPPIGSYILRFDLYMASEIPTKTLDKVQVICRFGHQEITSKKAELKKTGQAEYFQQFEDLKCVWPKDIRQVPDVVIDVENVSLIGGATSHIGYIRFRAEDVIAMLGKAPEWRAIVPDKTSAAYEEGVISGFLLFGLGLGRSEDIPPASQRPKVQKPQNLLNFEVRAHIYQARNLPAADDEGTSDPYVVISYGGQKAKTKTIEKTLFPCWYETLTLDVDIPDDATIAAPLIVMIYDWDSVGSDDFIGRIEVPFSQMTRQIAPEPKWHELYVGDVVEGKEGELLASFQLIPMAESKLEREAERIAIQLEKENQKAQEKLLKAQRKMKKKEEVPNAFAGVQTFGVQTPEDPALQPRRMPSIIPTTKPCTIQLKIIGCRNVLSHKFQSINNPYLEVDCGDIKISKKTQHCKVPTPDNPNFLEVLQFDVQLPLNSLYAPTLNARLYDYVGVRKKLLGTASIPLGPYFPWTNEERPRNNLPQVISSIPGSSDAEEIEEEDESTITPEQIAKRKEQKELKLLKEKMQDLIPDDITKANEDQKETFEILIDVDAEPGAGIRTMPEVSDTNVAGGDEVDKEQKQLTLQHELEFDLKKPPFDEFLLWRGQKYGVEYFLTRLVRKPGAPVGNRVVVGKIKGNISIYTQEKPARNDSTKATALLGEIRDFGKKILLMAAKHFEWQHFFQIPFFCYFPIKKVYF